MRRPLLVLAAALFLLGSPANLLLATDYYVVNNGSSTGGTGTQGDPFGTITEAINNISWSQNDTIFIAAGTYNEDEGESFPLHVPRGTTLQGDGSGLTIIEGLYPWTPRVTGDDPFLIYMDNNPTEVGLFTPEPLIVQDMTLRASGTTCSSSSSLGPGSSTYCSSSLYWSALIYGNRQDPSLQVRDCVLSGAWYGIRLGNSFMINGGESGLLGDPDPLTLAISNNTFVRQMFDGAEIRHFVPFERPLDFDFISNSFSGGYDGIDLEVRYTGCCFNPAVGGFSASYELNASYNDFVGHAESGMDLMLRASGGSPDLQAVGFTDRLNHTAIFLGNAASSVGSDGFHYDVRGGRWGELNMSMFATSNTVIAASDDGFKIDFSRTWRIAPVEEELGPGAQDFNYYGQFRYNSLLSCSDTGIDMDYQALFGGGDIYADVLMHFNLIEECGSGLAISERYEESSEVEGLGGGSRVEVLGNFRGNRIALNDVNGVRLERNEGRVQRVGVETNKDFGQLAPDFGRNTIQDNAQEFPGFDFVNSASSDVDAMGNWWGTTDSGTIAGNILDGEDETLLGIGFGIVDFECPLLDPVTFEVIPEIFNIPGLEIELVAGDKSAFVERIGNRDMVLNVAGLPANNVDVDDPLEDGPMNPLAAGPGGRLTATVPLGVPVGLGFLFVQNAGAQTGATAFGGAAIASKVSRCFIATASFGDEDAPEVLVLRKWRDEHLATNAFGRGIVSVYYALSPSLADSIGGSDTARSLTRAALAPVVGGVRLWMEMPWIYGIAGALLLFRLLRRRNG